MTSMERREKRYKRRVTDRLKKKEKLSQYDNFENVADFDNLYAMYQKCLRGVSWKESVQRYEANAMLNILETRKKLLAGESVHTHFIEFTLWERGKKRKIKGITITERVPLMCLCKEALIPILYNSIIYDNSASQAGKGTHFALRRLICHLSKYYRKNGSNDGYALLIDFSKYFDSVDHEVLFSLLEKKIKDKRLLELTKNSIKAFGSGKSLGLGSQVSQICAVFLPDTLDHYIKEKLRIKFYGRYMDDLYLIHKDKEYLQHCLTEIIKICDTLKLTVNLKKTRIVKLSQGLVFLKGKYTLLPTGKILKRPGKDSTKRMRRKLGKFKKLLIEKRMSYKDIKTSYRSWSENFQKRFHAYFMVRHMDDYYNNLFFKEHL